MKTDSIRTKIAEPDLLDKQSYFQHVCQMIQNSKRELNKMQKNLDMLRYNSKAYLDKKGSSRFAMMNSRPQTCSNSMPRRANYPHIVLKELEERKKSSIKIEVQGMS